MEGKITILPSLAQVLEKQFLITKVELKGGKGFQDSLSILGLKKGTEIKIKSFLPPMRYICLIDGKRHLVLLGGMAAKIFGIPEKRKTPCQLPLAPVNRPFKIKSILGGTKAKAKIEAMGVTLDTVICLEGIEPLPPISIGKGQAVIIETIQGLRIYLDKNQAELIWVK